MAKSSAKADRQRRFHPLIGVLMCALLGLPVASLRPVFVAMAAPITEESEHETKHESADRSVSARNPFQPPRPRLIDRHGLCAVTASASSQPHHSFSSFSASDARPDPFGNGLGTRLRC